MRSITDGCRCPKCGCIANKYHETYIRKVQNLPVFGKNVQLEIKAHEYDCLNDKCSTTSITENFNGFLNTCSRMTERCADFICTLASETSCEGCARKCRSLGIHISGDTVIRLLLKRYEIREYQNNAMKKGFYYDERTDRFICKQGKYLEFQKLTYKKSTQNYYRLYSRSNKECKKCAHFSSCATDLGTVRINASAYYPSFYRNSQKVGDSDYIRVMRLRQIWAEGTFAVLKREHKLNKIQKRGLQKATEECLLSATALNLKRLIKAV